MMSVMLLAKATFQKNQITDDWLYVIDYNIERTYEFRAYYIFKLSSAI